MKKVLFCILILILFYACSDENNSVMGNYQTADYSKAELYMKYLSYSGVSMGCELDLMADSTYLFQTCSIVSKGSWITENDSIILKETFVRWRNDSLHEFGLNGMPPKSMNNLSLYIDESNLKTVFLETYENKTETYFLRLEKIQRDE